MEYATTGKILQGVGGLYTIRLTASPSASTPLDGQTVLCRARGIFRHAGISPLPGDDVRIRYDETSFTEEPTGAVPSPDATGIRIEEILPRHCCLIRPPMANLDLLFVTLAAAKPAPLLPTLDRFLSIAEFNHVEPIVLVNKTDLNPAEAERLAAIYRHAGFRVFRVCGETGEGLDTLTAALRELLPGRIAAFGGASGVGKSTLLNRLFPALSRQTGSVSRKNEHGKHTTREVSLFPLTGLCPDWKAEGYIADTPGFSQLDLVNFDFFTKEDLPGTMRDFAPFLGKCRWADCTHTREDGCAVLNALATGALEPTRHESYLSMYTDLKDKHPWEIHTTL